MNEWNSRHGTAKRKLGHVGYVGQAAADAEDADQGYYMAITGPVDMPTAPMNPQGVPSFWQSLANTLPNLAEKGIALKQSLDIAKLNQELVRAGKAPLTASQIASLQPGVRVGLATDTQNIVIYGGLAILAVYALTKILK